MKFRFCFASLDSMKEAFTKLACRECLNGAGLDFEFKMAFQPVIDAETRTIYSHEALVRGPNGEGAATVLARVNEENRYRFDQSKIFFEVTEGERVTDHAHLKSIFAEYKKQGFQTAIDDFGAGYSGLNLLAEFQPDVIKLDMALIRNIDADRVRSIIVDAICRVCEELRIRVVAEGIETRAEFDHLRQKGLRYFQGYYFAKPVFDGLVRDIPALKVI